MTSGKESLADTWSFSPNDSIEGLPLSKRACNLLMRSGISKVMHLLSTPEHKIREIKQIGEKTFREIKSAREELASALSLREKYFLDLDEGLPLSIIDKLSESDINGLVELKECTFEDLVIHAHLTYTEAKRVSKSLSSTGDSLSKRWPEQPLVALSDYQFIRRSGIPLGKISVSRLVLPSELQIGLQLLEIETIDDLACQSRVVLETIIGTEHREQADILAKNLRRYLEWLSTQSSWDDEIEDRGISPISFIQLKEQSLEEVVDALVDFTISDRSRRVIRLRFGLDGGNRRTLEQIGKQMGLTRQRIRQIESRALTRLRNSAKKDGVLQAFYAYIAEEMKAQAGLMSVQQICETVAGMIDIGEIHIDGAISLLLSLESDQFIEIQKNQCWGLKGLPLHMVKPVSDQLVRILRKVRAPLFKTDLLERCIGSKWYSDNKLHGSISREFIEACLLADGRFEQVVDDQWGLVQWKGKRTDKIIMALRELGRPSHYTEIAEVTNRMLPPEQRISPKAYHTQISYKPDVFVWVERGTYGLAEWGIERVRFYVDIAEELLEQQGRPLSFEKIFSVIDAERKASPESIKFMLQTNPRFSQYPGDRFGLAIWSEKLDDGEDVEDPFVEDLKRKLFEDL